MRDFLLTKASLIKKGHQEDCGYHYVKGEAFMENRCVCCGVIIPEGMMVCKTCEIEAENRLTLKKKNRVSGSAEQPGKRRRLFTWGRTKGTARGVKAAH